MLSMVFLKRKNLGLNLITKFMKEQYSSLVFLKKESLQLRSKRMYQIKDLEHLLKREGRLLFSAFIKPIINGVGFDFKEVQISEEKRLDIVVTYNQSKYVIELKIWHSQEYHNKGIKQLTDYIDIQGLDKGYLVVYTFNKKKEYKQEEFNCDEKKYLWFMYKSQQMSSIEVTYL